ncbi:MAG: zinc ABC transporter substrate-binding protein [Rickettsiales bacterium]|nr:zinc ABC transporter substrate-binding protein [Rickettsiales bacterium]
MKQLSVVLLWGLLLVAPFTAQGRINIFACEPEWAALSEEIAGEKAHIKSATHAKQDSHYIKARPSLIASIRKADIVICSGGGLEEGWLPILLKRAPVSVQHSNIGHIMVTDHVEVLGIPKEGELDRSHGHIHASGNPHVHLNPYNISKAALVLKKRLIHIDEENTSYYQSRYDNFSKAWNASLEKWESDAASLKGMNIVVYHKNWLYLEQWLGLNRIASLEPKPGISPTVKHLEHVLAKAKKQTVSAVIRSPFEPDDASLWFAERTGAKDLMLPYTVGGTSTSTSLTSLFEETISLLKKVNNGEY